MFRANLTSTTLLAQLIPGMLLLVALLIAGWGTVRPLFDPAVAAFAAIKAGTKTDDAASFAALFAVLAFSSYVAAIFLGNMLAVVIGYLEVRVLDRRAAKHLKLDAETYNQEWNRYIDHLDDKRNPYISRVVESFTFELRTGLAGGVLSLVSFVFTSISPVWGFGGFLFSALLIKAGADDHFNLAEFRHRRFASSNLFSTDAEESIRKLITRWCEREEITPLGKLATIWRAEPTGQLDLKVAIQLLKEIQSLPPSVVFPAERDLIDKALASLNQRALTVVQTEA